MVILRVARSEACSAKGADFRIGFHLAIDHKLEIVDSATVLGGEVLGSISASSSSATVMTEGVDCFISTNLRSVN